MSVIPSTQVTARKFLSADNELNLVFPKSSSKEEKNALSNVKLPAANLAAAKSTSSGLAAASPQPTAKPESSLLHNLLEKVAQTIHGPKPNEIKELLAKSGFDIRKGPNDGDNQIFYINHPASASFKVMAPGKISHNETERFVLAAVLERMQNT